MVFSEFFILLLVIALCKEDTSFPFHDCTSNIYPTVTVYPSYLCLTLYFPLHCLKSQYLVNAKNENNCSEHQLTLINLDFRSNYGFFMLVNHKASVFTNDQNHVLIEIRDKTFKITLEEGKCFRVKPYTEIQSAV